MVIKGNWIPRGNDLNRLQGQSATAIAQLSNAVSLMFLLSNVMSQMVQDGDYTTIETYFGIPTGSGQTFHDVFGSANTALQASEIQGLIQRFG